MQIRMVLKMKFGPGVQGEDSFGLRLYGFFPDKLGSDADIGMVSENDSFSVPALTECQYVTFWFKLKKLAPYGKVSNMSKKVVDSLENNGYVKIRSSINNLVDTTHCSFSNRPESKFPLEPNTGGYNAADGFSLAVEKPGASCHYTLKDINEIRHMAVAFSHMVYGRRLQQIC